MTEENPYAPPEGELKVTWARLETGVAERNRWVGRLRFAAQACVGGAVLGFVMLPFSSGPASTIMALTGLLLFSIAVGLRVEAWKVKAQLRQQGQWDNHLAREGFRGSEQKFFKRMGRGLLVLILGLVVMGLIGK